MPRLGDFKSYPIKLTGLMDTRSTPDELPAGYLRLNRNITAKSTGRICRLPGWVNFGDNCGTDGADNSDLHDQLVRMAVGYPTYEFTIPGTREISGYLYPYQFPDTVTDGSYVQTDYSSTYGGYAPTTPISWSETLRFRHPARSHVDSLFIRSFFVGYPDFVDGGWDGTVEDSSYHITGLPYETSASHPYSTGSPWNYIQSHYYVSSVDWTDGQFIDGYPYGTPIPLFTSTEDSTYEYCGTQLSYRPYCDTYFSGYQGREAITLLHEFSSGEGNRKLVAATQSRIYALNGRAHNWRILADGLGGRNSCECGVRRFHVAQVGNTLVFTNDYDPILYWNFDSSVQDCGLQSAVPIEDLEELEVHKASVVVEYKGFLFLMNVELGGTRHIAKAIWSDYAAPLSFLPSNDSLAGDSDIGNPGEAIIDAKVLGDYLFVFKERSVWRLTLVDPDQGLFNIQQVYRGEKTPRYRNTITSTGEMIFYFGPDTIYGFDLFSQSPKELDWMHRAAGMIFDDNLVFSSENLAGGIEALACDQAVGGWDPQRQQLWFSWVAKKTSSTTSVSETTQSGFNPLHGVDCPNRSIMFNMRYSTASYVDHGFTAFVGYRPDNRPSLKDWLAELCVCDLDSWEDEDQLKQGQPCYNDLQISCPPGPMFESAEQSVSCPDPGILESSSSLPDGVSISGNSLILAAGHSTSDVSQEDADADALAYLQDLFDTRIALGTLLCIPDPPQANLCGWWKADSYSLTDGTAVGGTGKEWLDSSGNGNFMRQSSGAAQPLFKTNVFGSRPSLRFDGTDYLVMDNAFNFASPSTFTILVVYKHSAADNNGLLLGYQPGGGVLERMWSKGSGNTMNAFDTGINYNSSALTTSPTSIRAVSLRNTPGVPIQMFRENKTNIGPFTQSNIGFNFDTVGRDASAFVVFNGDIAEILIYCVNLSDAQLDAIYDDYLKVKYPTLP